MPTVFLFVLTGLLLFWSPARVFAASDLDRPGSGTEEQAANRFRGMDRNSDGVITRDEWRGSAQSFRVHDWNGDGVLSGAEVRTDARRDGRYDQRDYDQDQDDWYDWNDDGFTALDHNRDGRISANEWHFDRQSFWRADRNGDGVLSRSEFVASNLDDDRNDRFEYLDADNDGRIERNEWHGSEAAFNSLDRNRNGVLSRAEVAGEAAAVARPDTFASIDYNRDGVINRDEWHWSRGSFDARDADGNGVLSRREYAAAGNGALTGGRALHRELQVPSTQSWTDTGIDVRAGDVIRINADGTIQLSDNPNDRANPAGANRRAPNAPVLDAPAGGLLVRVGNSAPMFVGTNGSPTAPVSGRLYLGVNDDHLPDNAGQFRVTIDVAR
jgi:Ca2+-binding EF-hand superfamily protein